MLSKPNSLYNPKYFYSKSHKKSFNKKAWWIETIKDTYENNEQQMYEDITTGEIINTLKRTYEWKSPVIDNKTYFLLRHQFSSQLMTKPIAEIIKEPEKCLITPQKE